MAAAGAAGATTSSTPGISGSAGTTVTGLKPGFQNRFVTQTFGAGQGAVTTSSGTADYDSFVDISPTEVSFESADVAIGNYTNATSTSSVSFTFTNGSSKSIIPKFQSSVVPAGMGFYLADINSSCASSGLSGCAPTTGGATFSQLSLGDNKPALGLASASFDFKVLSDGAAIYDLAGSVFLNGDFVVVKNLGQASTLNNFQLATPVGSLSNVGYTWDATPIKLSAPALAPGDSRTITYQVTVSAFSQSTCVTPTTCLVAYAGFGDPVGGGDGINLHASSLAHLFGAGPSNNGSFFPVNFIFPQFNTRTGTLTFTPNGVPEPGTWLMLLTGAAFIGVSLRGARRARQLA